MELWAPTYNWARGPTLYGNEQHLQPLGVDTKLNEALKGQDPKILDVFFEDFLKDVNRKTRKY